MDADAAPRFGGGTSIGKQRQINPYTQGPGASAVGCARRAGTAAVENEPVAGAACLSRARRNLASLFMGNGIGGAFGNIVMMLLIAAAAMFVWSMLRRKPQSLN